MDIQRLLFFLLSLFLTGCAIDGRQATAFSPRIAPIDAQVQQRADLIYEVLTAEVAGKLGDVESATEHYVRASELSDDEQVAERAVRIALFARDFDAAIKAIDRWSEINPDSLEVNQLAGVLYLRKKEPQKALEHFIPIIEHNPDNPEIGFARIMQLLNGDKATPEGLQVMAALQQRYSQHAIAHRSFADMAYRMENYTAALDATRKALAIEPDNQSTLVLQNRLLLETGQAELALSNMRGLIEQNPEDTELLLNYARMQVLARQYPEALESFAKALERKPNDPDLIYSTALLELELKHYDRAERYFTQLTLTESHANEANYYLGEIAQQKKQFDQSIGWYNRVREGEYYLEAQIRIAQMLTELGQKDEARAHLVRLRKMQAHDALKTRLYLAEGELLQDQENYTESMNVFDAALEEYPDNIELLYGRAMVGEKMDRLDILERDLNAILKIEPDNATALNALGYTLADRTNRYQEAYVLIEKALALKPDDPAILDSMGWVKYRLGDLQAALNYLLKAWSKFPDPEIASHLTQIYWALGQQEQARKTLEKALADAPDDARLLKLKNQLYR